MAGKVAIVGVVLLVACKGAPKGTVSATQRGDQVVIEVHTEPDVSISIPTSGVEESSSSEHRFPATAFPVGKQTLTVVLSRAGKQTKIDVSFDRKPIEPSLKLESTASETYEPTCRGEFCEAGTRFKLDTKTNSLAVKVIAPAGQKITLAGKPLKAGTIPLEDLVATVPLPDALSDGSWKRYVDVPIKLELDGKSKEGLLGISLNAFRAAIRTAVANIEAQPVRFADDGAQPTKPRSLVWLDDYRYYGKPGTLREVDLIAVAKKREPRALGKCGPYKGETGETMAQHQAIDLDVVVYERRTGTKVAEKKFVAPAGVCPKALMVLGKTFGESGVFIQTEGAKALELPPKEPIGAWLATLVPKG